MSSRRSLASLAGLAALGAVLATPADAFAGPAIGADLNLVFPVDQPGADTGAGFDIRLGNKINFPVLSLTPEIKGGYFGYSGTGAVRIQGGLRAGLNVGILEPGAFVHLGYGHNTSADTGAFAYDAGAYLDLTLLPLISFGIHGAFNEITLSPVSQKTVDVGVHAALTF